MIYLSISVAIVVVVIVVVVVVVFLLFGTSKGFGQRFSKAVIL